MSKRGAAELLILVAVLVIAIVGLYFAFKGTGQAAGYNFECKVECSPPKAVDVEMFVTTSSEEAQSMCKSYAAVQCKPGVPFRAVASSVTGNAARGDPLYYYNYPGSESPMVACERACMTYEGNSPACLEKCSQFSSKGDPYAWRPTGEFAVPGQKEYGGAIRGISDESSRAFGGRAYEIPQRCFECSCGGVYSTQLQDAAALACQNKCGGTIVESSC